MKFLFDDNSFSFEALRVAELAKYGGADLGEIIVTAQEIPDGDEVGWHRAWKRTAERVHALAEEALTKRHRMSAREAFLRASNYYRTAEFFLRDDPAQDPEAKLLSARSRETFAAAAKLMDAPVEVVNIPYEGTTLPGYLFLVDDSSGPRPTVVFTSGFDSTLEEAYLAVGAAALQRGYNVLAYDGPGQGAALRAQGLHFRHDWEAVVRPVIDYARTRRQIAPESIALVGHGLAGYLVARAAAFEPRIAALVLSDGVLDCHETNWRAMPPFFAQWLRARRDNAGLAFAELVMSRSTGARRALRNGRWAFGATSVVDYICRTASYALEGVVEEISCPTLVVDAESDEFFRGRHRRIAAALRCPTTLLAFKEAEGAREHCHMGAMARCHQEMFDWLDDVLDERRTAHRIHPGWRSRSTFRSVASRRSRGASP